MLLTTIPGVGDLLGLTIAVVIGDIERFGDARKLVGYSGLTPRVKQSGQSSRTGKLSKSGSKLLRWAAIEAAQQAWRPSNPWHQLYRDVKARKSAAAPRQGSHRPQGADRRRHVLALEQAGSSPRAHVARTRPGRSGGRSGRTAAHKEVRSRDSSNRHGVRPQAPKES